MCLVANRFVFGLCWALAPVPLLFRCGFWWRNANFVVLVLSGWCSAWICPHLKETTVFLVEFLSQLTCLYQFQDRVLERYRPYQRKNKSVTPPQTGSLARRAMEEWERSICENQAFANLRWMQTGRSTLIKKDGGEMLVAMALDRPLADAQALVRDPPKLIEEILQIMQDKQSHPVIEGMVKANVRDDLPTSEFALASSASSSTRQIRHTPDTKTNTAERTVRPISMRLTLMQYCQRG